MHNNPINQPEVTLKLAKKAYRTAVIALLLTIVTVFVLLYTQCMFILNQNRIKHLKTHVTQRKKMNPGILC